jgi:hypothetical protein
MSTSRIDALPMDVIRHVLYPYLDYHGRVGINALLQPYERMGTPLTPRAALQVQFALSATAVRRGLTAHDNLTGQERHEHIFTFMSTTVRKNLCMTQHNASYRRTVLAKLAHFGDPSLPDYSNCTEDFCRRMTAVCLDIIIDIKTKYPYLYDLTLPNIRAGWSPVNAGPHVVTDNEVYLEAARAQQIAEYKARLIAINEKRKATMDKRHNAMAERQATMAERQATMAERQATMAERQATMAERQIAATKRQAAIAKGQAALFNRVLIPQNIHTINSIQSQPHNYWLR